ncbi:MAG TPA: cysteine desulfurase family protein [Balneolaceae bacterium]|nr:cysteine desulfurase family protein [Balneolaceae bacterium]
MKNSSKIYLDYNATTPVDERVVEAMLPFFTRLFGNASSNDHIFGWEADDAVDVAREQLADLIGASANEIYFTSGATEAINLGLRGFCNANKARGNHIITCKTEHKAVLETCRHLEEVGFDITYLDVNFNGAIDLDELKTSITKKTLLVCLMHANNETGVIHPVKEIAELCRSKGVRFFSDATQSVGKLPINVKEMCADMIAFSSHKLYGPKGAGALYIAGENKPTIYPLFTGGGQEKGLRPGTLNVPAIVGFGKACEICKDELAADADRLSDLRNYVEQELIELFDVSINSSSEDRLPHTTNVQFKNIDSIHLLRRLRNLAISRGSACSSAISQPSHVLTAMGLSADKAMSSIRIGLGRFTTREEVHMAIKEFEDVIPQLKLVAG